MKQFDDYHPTFKEKQFIKDLRKHSNSCGLDKNQCIEYAEKLLKTHQAMKPQKDTIDFQSSL